MLSKMTDGKWDEHLKSDHIPYRPDCAVCIEAASRDRPHSLQANRHLFQLSTDVAGPFKAGVDFGGSHRFFMAYSIRVPVLKEAAWTVPPPEEEEDAKAPPQDRGQDEDSAVADWFVPVQLKPVSSCSAAGQALPQGSCSAAGQALPQGSCSAAGQALPQNSCSAAGQALPQGSCSAAGHALPPGSCSAAGQALPQGASTRFVFCSRSGASTRRFHKVRVLQQVRRFHKVRVLPQVRRFHKVRVLQQVRRFHKALPQGSCSAAGQALPQDSCSAAGQALTQGSCSAAGQALPQGSCSAIGQALLPGPAVATGFPASPHHVPVSCSIRRSCPHVSPPVLRSSWTLVCRHRSYQLRPQVCGQPRPRPSLGQSRVLHAKLGLRTKVWTSCRKTTTIKKQTCLRSARAQCSVAAPVGDHPLGRAFGVS